jgi:hypothetical protein
LRFGSEHRQVAHQYLELIGESPPDWQAHAMFGGRAWPWAASGDLPLIWYLLVPYNESKVSFTPL